MTTQLPVGISSSSLATFVLALADDELVLGHRDSEWTGYGPILEEDIAFSNIAQDELGHSLVWFTLYQDLTGKEPDTMVFKRTSRDFSNCRFVEYPRGDFAYTVARQFFFDVAEEVRLKILSESSYAPLASSAERILKEEAYHRLHSEGLFTRLAGATEESCRRMQGAMDVAFPQALGMFEHLSCEKELVSSGVFKGNVALEKEWLGTVVPIISALSLKIPVDTGTKGMAVTCQPEYGGRSGNHTAHLRSLVNDLQSVLSIAPEAKW
jgi:ring-1,2-phenylacetyl-CoA epoxidase subunit PaaC